MIDKNFFKENFSTIVEILGIVVTLVTWLF